MGILTPADVSRMLFPRGKILVIDDDRLLCEALQTSLEHEGYRVTVALTGGEGLYRLTNGEGYDLVLLDVLLPKLSGFDVLEKLKAEGKPLPKVIVFSNFAQKADVERAHALGAVDYIVKAAFSPAEILTKIKGVFAAAEGVPAAPAPADGAASAAAPAAPQQNPATDAYQSFASMQDVMPMSEVLRPGEPNNNP